MDTNTITLTSPRKTKFSHSLSNEYNSTHLHDASFSSNFSSAEEILAESKQQSSTTRKEPLYGISFARKKTEDGEISIFGAEKYFNEGMDEEQNIIPEKGGPIRQPKNDERNDPKNRKPKIKTGTLSASSEVSWKSQSTLFPVLIRDSIPNLQNKVKGIKFFTTFGWKCSCSDDKYVDIDKNVEENKSPRNCKNNVEYGVHSKETAEVPIKINQDLISLVGTIPESQFKEEIPCQKFENISFRLQREVSGNFPVLNSGEGNMIIKRRFEEEEEEEEKERMSLEVFGSPILDKGDTASRLERRLTGLTWDANPRVEDIQADSCGGGVHEDIDSDSSSDLFEIKSLSSNAQPFFSYGASDDMSSRVTPTKCHVPTKASTVTNPEAAIVKHTTTATNVKNVTGKKVQRHCPNALLGCRSHKAVRVVSEMSKKAKADTRRRHRSDYLTPTANFQTGAKATDFRPAQVQPTFTPRSFSRSHSAHASRSLRTN